MACLNKVQLIGNLGRDPEVRHTPTGTAVAVFSMAMTDKVKGEDRTEWMEVEAWDKLAEICQKYVTKGQQIYVEGRLKTESWNDRETGNKRSKVKVVATNLILLGRKNGGNPAFGEKEQAQAPSSTGRPVTAADPISDEDIPF